MDASPSRGSKNMIYLWSVSIVNNVNFWLLLQGGLIQIGIVAVYHQKKCSVVWSTNNIFHFLKESIVADRRKSSKLTACKSPEPNIPKILEMVVMWLVRQSFLSCHCVRSNKRWHALLFFQRIPSATDHPPPLRSQARDLNGCWRWRWSGRISVAEPYLFILSFLIGYVFGSLNRQIDCPSHRLLRRMNIRR